MSTARHPRTSYLKEQINETIQTILRMCYEEFGSDLALHLSMVEFIIIVRPMRQFGIHHLW
jgi:hypothetical protein